MFVKYVSRMLVGFILRFVSEALRSLEKNI